MNTEHLDVVEHKSDCDSYREVTYTKLCMQVRRGDAVNLSPLVHDAHETASFHVDM